MSKTTPDLIVNQSLTIGGSWVRTFELIGRDDEVLDLSPGTVDVFLRFRPQGSSDVATVLSKGGGDTSYPTDGTDGQISFYMESAQTDALSEGLYDLEIVYTRTDEVPQNKTLYGQGTLYVAAPKTGAI